MSNQVWLFMAATAMATTVSTLAATAMVKADAPEATTVTCACEAAPAAAPIATAPIATAPIATAPIATAPIATAPERQAAAEDRENAAEQPEPEPRVVAPSPAPKAKVVGPLDQDIIRRIVKAHINEVRYCYNQGLSDDPELAGRVVVQFTIGGEGRVTKSEVSSTNMQESGVPQCVAGAVERWMFPKPDNGENVEVTYPFVLEPG